MIGMRATVVLGLVVPGAFFLGIATALALVWFGGFQAFRLPLTLTVGAVAGAFLTLGALGLRSSLSATSHQPRAPSGIEATRLRPRAPLPATPPSVPPRASSSQRTEPDRTVRRTPAVGTPIPESPKGPPRAGVAPPQDVEPEPAPDLRRADLIQAWKQYRRDGDGHFNALGMSRVLERRHIPARARSGERIGLGTSVLIVERRDGPRGNFFVLPSFTGSPRAVREWFDDSGAGRLTARTERLISVAEGRWTSGGYEQVTRGEVA